MAKVEKRSALQVWGDVIFAIFLREIRSSFNDKFGLSWALISPMIMITVMVVIRGAFSGGYTHGMPTAFFVLYGVVLVQFFLGTLSKTATAIQKNKPLYAFRQVQPISSIIAIAGFELIVKFFLLVLLATIAYLAKVKVEIANPLAILAIMLQVWLIALSCGVLFGLAKCYVKEVAKLEQIITRPIFFISGIFFSLQDIPKEYWPYLDWNPLLHAVELARYSAYSAYGDAGVSHLFLSSTTALMFFFALACYHVGWKQAISR